MINDELKPKGKVEEGAPEWVVTFGDLMSLLLCFFVLLLSFSEMDRKQYKLVSGSMANAFGVQKQTPAFESPKGQKMVAKDFDQAILATKLREYVAKPVIIEVEERFQKWKDLIDVEVGDDKVTIRLMGETGFDSGSAEIREEMLPLLKKIGEIIKDRIDEILIAGHTDNVPLTGGKYRSNLGLSMARAASVAQFMLEVAGISPERMSTMGFGEYRPIATNTTAKGRQRNRRVEIVLTSWLPDRDKFLQSDTQTSTGTYENTAK
jgi:chemotaxis protein MotB